MNAHGSSPPCSRSVTTEPSSSCASARSPSRLARRRTSVIAVTDSSLRRAACRYARPVTRLVRLVAVSALALGLVAAPAAALAEPLASSPPALPAVAALPPVAALPGDAGNFSFRSFHSDYRLGRAADQHATLAVTETLVALFPQSDQNHGIIRDIPATYGSADLQTEVASV